MTLPAYDIWPKWREFVSDGWNNSQAGALMQAQRDFESANALTDDAYLPPALEFLRHQVGRTEGIDPDERLIVRGFSFDEDEVYAMVLPEENEEWPNYSAMQRLRVPSREVLAERIRKFIGGFYRQRFSDCISNHPEHVMAMSTGRCGTVALHRLFGQSPAHLPYHLYTFNASFSTYYEMLCRLVDGNWETVKAPYIWAKTRAAEWTGADINNRAMVGTNHRDTLFAPVFAAIHPFSKFVWLRRNPADVFKSYFAKGQWNDDQLAPVYYDFSEGFRWARAAWDMSARIAWFLQFTDAYCAAFADAVGEDRLIMVSSDNLFAQDEEEIARLVEFTGCEHPDPVAHFAKPINAKTHKALMPDYMVEHGMQALEWDLL